MTVESYKWTENDLHVGDSIYLAKEGAGDYLCTIRINSRSTVVRMAKKIGNSAFKVSTST